MTYEAEERVQLPWSDQEVERLKSLWDVFGGRFGKIAKIMGRTRGSIDGKSRSLGLQFHGKGRARILDAAHPAVLEKRTLYPARLAEPGPGLLKTGDNNRKLGGLITKGKWKGFPLFSLSLEERATCPTTCAQFRSCYGNGSGHAIRYKHGPKLEMALIKELAYLNEAHPNGFALRIHSLGDFYSREYVRFWGVMLDEFPALHIFGYSNWKSTTPIGAVVQYLRNLRWERFAIRTSDGKSGPRTIVFRDKVPAGAIQCPAQTGATKNCAECGLCWATAAREKPVAFRQH